MYGRELPDGDLVGQHDAARFAAELAVHGLAADNGVGAHGTTTAQGGARQQHGAGQQLGAAADLDARLHDHAGSDFDAGSQSGGAVDDRRRRDEYVVGHGLTTVDEGEGDFGGDLFAHQGAGSDLAEAAAEHQDGAGEPQRVTGHHLALEAGFVDGGQVADLRSLGH